MLAVPPLDTPVKESAKAPILAFDMRLAEATVGVTTFAKPPGPDLEVSKVFFQMGSRDSFKTRPFLVYSLSGE